MDVSLFDFDLQPRLIALRPARPRDAARMLVVGRDGLEDRGVKELVAYLRPGDVMVMNDTRVLPVRLKGRRGEARVEATLTRRLDDGGWRALARPAKRLRAGDTIEFPGLVAEVTGKGEGGEVTLRFDKSGENFRAALDHAGVMPLPPYIAARRAPDSRDLEDYQTVFATRDGAIAAPTAGLHFTAAALRSIEAKGVELVTITLHVGAGTFLPVKCADTADHRMEAEYGEISEHAAGRVNAARAAGGRIVAVGSTSLRLLEAAAGADGAIAPFAGETDIFIAPGYRFRAVDLLLTNFHLPRSTLFMLVSAFSGLERMRAAYVHAMAQRYRFYSYGDACLLYRA